MAEIIILLIICVYIVFLVYVSIIFNRNHTSFSRKHQPKVAVIIAFRNESKNLQKLLDSLLAQEYQNYEVYLVNDHSTDDFQNILNAYSDERIHLLHLNEGEKGKKSAITFGVTQCTAELLLFTDADCWMENNWISSMVDELESENSDWLSGPIFIHSKGTWIEDFQQLESAYLGAISRFCIKQKIPTTCNGANIMMRRNVFLEINGFEGIEQTPSGDDELLMQKLALAGYNLNASKNKKCLVSTSAQEGFEQTLNQRIRWASKLKYNLLRYNFMLSVLIFLFHLASIVILFLDWKFGILFWTWRLIVEFILAKQIFKWLDSPLKMIHFLISFFVYPLYVIFMSVATQLKAYQWKERKY